MNINPDVIQRAEQAKRKLLAQLQEHPDVRLIDIGRRPSRSAQADDLVLRIHVRRQQPKTAATSSTSFPEEVNGIPVIIVTGDFKLE